MRYQGRFARIDLGGNLARRELHERSVFESHERSQELAVSRA
jgi:hypothetical protein